VKGHKSILLKIVPWDGRSPMFLGTDLNFSCGGVEVADVNYSNDYISGLLETDWFVPVKLTFVIPSADGYEVKQIVTTPGQKKFYLRF